MTTGPAGTIYRDETGFDEDLKIEIEPAKTTIIEELRATETSSVFHINYDGEPRVLKVFHNKGDPGYSHDGVRDFNRSRCEIRAYCSLKRHGVCDSGYVPQFYGFAVAANPANFLHPHFNTFQHDRGPPRAILIEHLPNALVMDSDISNEERMGKAIIGIQQIHLALVEHNDPYPKNILIVPGDPERVVWMDFDTASAYPDSKYIGDRERNWMERGTEKVKTYGAMLVGGPLML